MHHGRAQKTHFAITIPNIFVFPRRNAFKLSSSTEMGGLGWAVRPRFILAIWSLARTEI